MSQGPSPAARAGSLLLSLLPPARMAWIVFTHGEDNLSNDYVLRSSLVASMVDGTCSIGKFLREAWIGGAHSGLAIFPIYYLNARFFGWSVWVELGLGLALVAATLALLAAAIPGRTRWLLLPLLSLLLFSTSRVTVFTFGECALQYGFSQLGLAVGVFALGRWRERPIALAGALAFGGLLASWSWGGGVMAWPVFAIALVALRVRSFAAWAIFLSGSIAGVAQYAWFLLLGAPNQGTASLTRALRVRPVLDLLGRPFLNGIGTDMGPRPAGVIAGLAGLVALAGLFAIRRRRGLPSKWPALVLVGWSLLVALQIVTFRADVPPWYASPMAFFWAGLALLLADTGAPLRFLGISAIALLALRVQASWEDKSFYLPSRAPASAACLREWRTATRACHDLVFQWRGVNLFETALLGDMLERRRLSVFSSSRTYLLQGDVALGRVAVETPSLPAFLSRDGRTRGDPNDFHRLDVVLAPGGSVAWRVDLPPNLKSARFLTRVHAGPGDEKLTRGARVTVSAEGSPLLLEERMFLPREAARPLSVDLSPLGGRKITLRLAAEETQRGVTPLVFEAPRIEIRAEDDRR